MLGEAGVLLLGAEPPPSSALCSATLGTQPFPGLVWDGPECHHSGGSEGVIWEGEEMDTVAEKEWE